MVKIYSVLVRHPLNYNHVLERQKELIFKYHTKPEEFKIETIIELSKEEFVNFKNNLSIEYDFTKNEDGIILVKEKYTENNTGIVIDVQGSSNATFAGIPVEECDIKKCPHCSKYYIEPSAISRTDNKLKICSECGMKEALELFQEYKKSQDFKKFIENAKITANIYNAKITVAVPGENDIVIEPTK